MERDIVNAVALLNYLIIACHKEMAYIPQSFVKFHKKYPGTIQHLGNRLKNYFGYCGINYSKVKDLENYFEDAKAFYKELSNYSSIKQYFEYPIFREESEIREWQSALLNMGWKGGADSKNNTIKLLAMVYAQKCGERKPDIISDIEYICHRRGTESAKENAIIMESIIEALAPNKNALNTIN